jgi:hypothetical protein
VLSFIGFGGMAQNKSAAKETGGLPCSFAAYEEGGKIYIIRESRRMRGASKLAFHGGF